MKPMTTAEIAAAMGCKSSAATARLAALGYTDTCGRCGGSGRYSYNQVDGDRCFGCGGAGKRLAKITAAIVDAALARIAAGELAGYFAEIKARRDMKAATDALRAVYLSTTTGKAYTRASMAHVGGLLESPLGRANDLINAMWDAAIAAEFDRKSASVTRIATIREATRLIPVIDAAAIAAGVT